MPRQALGESEYFGGTCGSSTSDSEHEQSLPSLGHSEVLRVQAPPGPHIPEFRQPAKDDGKVPSSNGGQKTGDVLDQNPAGQELANDAMELVPEPRTCPLKARTASRNAEILAREPAADEVNGSECCSSGW
jgi:hypothetical protein